MVSKFIKRGTNKENVREHWNIGQFSKGTTEQGPPLGDPHCSYAHLSGTTTMSVPRLRTSRLQNEGCLYFYNFEEIFMATIVGS